MKKQIYLFAIVITILSFHYQSFAQQIETSATSKTGIHKTDAFGLDLGVGALLFKDQIYNYNYSYTQKRGYPVFAIGIRYTHLFNPYIGADVIKVNLNCPFRAKREQGFINMQLMTGIRGITPVFLKTMSGYAVVRMGYGLRFPVKDDENDKFEHGIAFETELGLNITRNVFIGFSYNLLSLFIDVNTSDPYWHEPQYLYSENVNFNTYALRIGFNF